MSRRRGVCLAVAALIATCAALGSAQQPQNLVPNPGFEQAEGGWRGTAWSREEGAVQINLDAETRHEGQASLHIIHTGEQDWSWQQAEPLAVQPGDIMEITGWFQAAGGSGHIECSLILYDPDDEVISWSFGTAAQRGVTDWKHVCRRFVIPERGARALFRVIGGGEIEAWVDECSWVKKGSIEALRAGKRIAPAQASNQRLQLTVGPDGGLQVLDRRANYTWRAASGESQLVTLSVDGRGRTVTVEALEVATDQRAQVTWELR